MLPDGLGCPRCPLTAATTLLLQLVIVAAVCCLTPYYSSISPSSGGYMGMMSVLMQLRKVCNHPDLFEERAISVPLMLPQLTMQVLLCHLLPLCFWPLLHEHQPKGPLLHH